MDTIDALIASNETAVKYVTTVQEQILEGLRTLAESAPKFDEPVSGLLPTSEPLPTRDVVEEAYLVQCPFARAQQGVRHRRARGAQPRREACQGNEEVIKSQPMDSPEEIWKQHLRTLGGYIKAQRQISQLTQRELARLADLSDTYMSQLERGMHEPSIRVLKSLAESLGIRPDQLIMYASGLSTDEADVDTEEAIRRDARLTASQRRAMESVLRSYLDDNAPQ